MKTILNKLFVLCAFVVTLTGCELYMDDRDIQLGNPVADGDGYSAPATYMDSITTVTYQFNENTVYINETYRPYIFSANVDTTSKSIEIRFAKSIPSDMLPQRGNGLATSLYDIFNANVCHKVDVVEEADGLYVVKGHAVLAREVFKHLVVEGGFYAEGDTTNSGNDSRTGENTLITGIKLRPINHDYTGRADNEYWEKDEDGMYRKDLVDINTSIGAARGVNSLLEKTKVGKSINNFFSNKKEALLKKVDNDVVKFNAEFDGFVGVHEALTLCINFKFDYDNGWYDFYMLMTNEVYLGAGFTKFKGSIVFPMFGGRSVVINTKSTPNEGNIYNPDKLGQIEFQQDDYWIKCKKIGTVIPLGAAGIIEVYFTPNVIMEFYASMIFEEPVGAFLKKRTIIGEFGRHKDDKTEYTYGEDGHKTNIPNKKEENYLKLIDEIKDGDEYDTGFYTIFDMRNNFSVDFGISLTAALEFGLIWDGVVNLYAQVTPTFDFHYSYNNKYLYNFDVNVPDPETGDMLNKLSSDYNSNLQFDISLTATMGGRFDARLFTIDLFRTQCTLPILYNKMIFDPFKAPKVKYNHDKTTSKIDAYDATINIAPFKTDFASDPYLAIYKIPYAGKNWTLFRTEDLEFVCITKAKRLSGTQYEFDIRIPSDYIVRYLALPIYDTPFGYKYGRGSIFEAERSIWGHMDNIEQLTIENGEMEDGSQYYGFKLDVTGQSTKDVNKWALSIHLTDNYTHKSTSNTYIIDNIKDEEVKKYMFFFKGNSPSGYSALIWLNYYTNDDPDYKLADAYVLELSPYMGGETVVDMEEVLYFPSMFSDKFPDYKTIE